MGPATAAATALMRPWKNRAIDHVVCVSNAVASGNRIPPGPHTSVIPNFVLDEAVLRRAGDVAEGRAEDTPPSLPKEEFLLFVGELSRDKGLPTLLRAYEAHPVAVMEALTVGRPVVGYDIAGTGELSAAGWVHGVPRGAPAAQALVKTMSSPALVDHADLPSWDSCADQLAHVYRSSLGIAPGRRAPGSAT